MKSIGLDIGTTTICGILMDSESGEMLKKITLQNDTQMEGERPFERLQHAEKIEEKCCWIVDHLSEEASDLASIGITGQMHGILYLDADGNALSPLITWQDGRGDEIYQTGVSYAQVLSGATGYALATGFGAVTHFYNQMNGLIPNRAVTFCTIADYIAMRLAGNRTPLLHASMAASLGIFRMDSGCFDEEKIKAAGMQPAFFPPTLEKEISIGMWRGCVPVSPAFGDNQASFLGAVGADSRILVNVGTGSQVSILGDCIRTFANMECRPFMEKKYLYVGCSLCGGHAYALLKQFFESVLKMCGMDTIPDLYEKMNAVGAQAEAQRLMQPQRAALSVDTRFRGDRKNPSVRGKIEGLSPFNFFADDMVLGVLEGICEELKAFYREYQQQEEVRSHTITGSGNGIRQNALLQRIFSRQFEKEMRIPRYAEEAAYGSSLFSLYTSGIYDDLSVLREIVIERM